MNNAFSCALFDLDGTLTDPQEGIINSVLYALNKFGITARRADLLCFIGPPLVESFSEYFGFSRADSLKAVEYYREYFSDIGIFENKVFDGTVNCLERLKESGVKIILATSKPQAFAERILHKFELTKYFNFVAGATFDEERNNKTQVIRYALENCDENDAKKLIMIGDRKHDILGAKQCGLKSCGVLFGYGSEEELTCAGADYLATDFEQVFNIITKGKTA